MEGKSGSDDIHEHKSKEATALHDASISPDVEKEADGTGDPAEILGSPVRQETAIEQSMKRGLSDLNEGGEEGDEETKRKKRKDSEGAKESARIGSSISGRCFGGRNGNGSNKCAKNHIDTKNGNSSGGKGLHSNTSGDRKSPNNGSGSASSSPKLNGSTGNSVRKTLPCVGAENEGEEVRGSKCNSTSSENTSSWTGRPKVPPLKIVIPQQNSSVEQEQGNRNGKAGTTRHHLALPYVVAASNGNESSTDKELNVPTSGAGSSLAESVGSSSLGKGEEKKDSNIGSLSMEEQRSSHHQRVLRSSHRSGGGNGGQTMTTSGNQSSSCSAVPVSSASPTRPASNNSATLDGDSNHSPPPSGTQGQSPSPTELVAPITESTTVCATKPIPSTSTAPPLVEEKIVELPVEPSQLQPTVTPQLPHPVQLHPRKRKIKQNKESQVPLATVTTTPTAEVAEASSTSTEVEPLIPSVPNGYQSFRNIRKQVDRRRKGLFPVQPKPPQGFKDYLMNRCSYLLAGNAASCITISMASPPPNLQLPIQTLFVEQEKERRRLQMQHIVEKEKLVLAVEQEILRVHGRAARALANQALPFSVCTILKDEEVYTEITPEEEEKDRNARSRYNGRLFLSWLQDVDDKWEKIKEGMLIRHHFEADSLRGVQRMDWEWKMKELGMCEYKASPVIDDTHVPIVNVSDDFDLLPA